MLETLFATMQKSKDAINHMGFESLQRRMILVIMRRESCCLQYTSSQHNTHTIEGFLEALFLTVRTKYVTLAVGRVELS